MSDWLTDIDYHALFMPDVSLYEMFVRGTIVFFALFVMLRIIRRQMGSLGTTDLLVVVVLADAAQNAMSATYQSISSGLFLVATIIFWNILLDYLADHFAWLERFLHPKPILLVRNGRLHRKNMQRQLITDDDLLTEMRLQGVAEIAQVRQACLEGDGKISIIKFDTAPNQ